MMNIPPHVRTLLDREVMAVRRDPSHALLPYRRLLIYDAFGPTFATSTYEERVQILKEERLPLTIADRVRAQLALLTAKYVLPFWQSALEETGLLTSEHVMNQIRSYLLDEMIELYVVPEARPVLLAQLANPVVDYTQLREQIAALVPNQIDPAYQTVLLEWVDAGRLVATMAPGAVVRIPLDPRLALHRSIYLMPMTEAPVHIMQLAEGVLHGTVNPSNALSQSAEINNCLGNFLGYTEEEFPARAYDVCEAALEALKQALGLGPFDRQEVTSTTTDAWLMGEGAAAAAALKAYSGVFEGNISTNLYDPEKQLEFWLWWLTEAIPQAWATEQDAADPPGLATMPFTATVQVTQYRTGVTFTFEEPSEDE